MGFMDNIKNFMSVNDEIDEEEYGYEEEEIENESTTSFFSGSDREAKSSSPKGKYLNINANSKLSVVLVKPESFSEASSIADHLNSKRTVVLNLESSSKDVSRRLVDFLSGVAYANNGTLKKVANCTYIITPYNVDVMGDELLDDFSDGNGIYI